MFSVLKVSKNYPFLTPLPPTSAYVIYEWSHTANCCQIFEFERQNIAGRFHFQHTYLVLWKVVFQSPSRPLCIQMTKYLRVYCSLFDPCQWLQVPCIAKYQQMSQLLGINLKKVYIEIVKINITKILFTDIFSEINDNDSKLCVMLKAKDGYISFSIFKNTRNHCPWDKNRHCSQGIILGKQSQ